jgi:signal transduction histidine kinase
VQLSAVPSKRRIVPIDKKARLAGSRPSPTKKPNAQKRKRIKSASALRKNDVRTVYTHTQSRALPGNLLRLMDEERRQIAREVHDELGQQVAHIEFGLERLAMRLPTSHEEIATQLQAIRRELNEFSKNLRQTAHRLHPAILEHLDFATVIRSYAAEFIARTGMSVRVTSTRVPPSLTPELGSSLYSIVREALTNAYKHAGPGAAVVVDLTCNGPTLALLIKDSGCGFNVDGIPSRGGLGLLSIRERVHLLNGSVLIDSAPGAGVCIHIVVPIS